MEVWMRNLDTRSDLYDVKAVLAKVLHSENPQSPFNFHVSLNKADTMGFANDGTGSLIFPTKALGSKFIKKIRNRELQVKISRRRISFEESKRSPSKGIIEMLKKVPYQDPVLDKREDDIRQQLSVHLRIDKLEFGCWANGQTKFCIEWSKEFTSIGNAVLGIDYKHKLIRIQIGDSLLDDIAYSVVLKFARIRRMWIGSDYGNQYICFDMVTPPILECEWINRTTTGIIYEDERKFRERIGSIDDGHNIVAPYAHHVRVTLFEDSDLDKFVQMCSIAGIQTPRRAKIDAENHYLFTSKRLRQIEKVLERLPYPVSFQVEALLHNGLLNTNDLQNTLLGPIEKLSKSYDQLLAGTIMRYFVHFLPQKPSECDLLTFFRQACEDRLEGGTGNINKSASGASGLMLCHHVTFTPTRMMLEGPYAIQSNRVIRRYAGFHDHFIRVDFRDEDRLQYRWDREVDGATFLRARVGGILRDGFTLAGRKFQFLAYSSSALRSHAVWFMNPFEHPTEGVVTAAKIRNSLGDFSALLNCPARFGARLSQAFTATDPSVRITRDQWSTMPDIGDKPYFFTDGVGTISPDLGHLIYKALCNDKPQLTQQLEPDVYQIRFLGYKGVVRVDRRLTGIQMRLRPSMEKFKVHQMDELEADIEIAQAFNSPGKMYLNRPLIMILEDRKVRRESFMDLQHEAIASARLAKENLQTANNLLKSFGFGSQFNLVTILQNFASHGLDMKHPDVHLQLKYPFLKRLVNCCISSVLRDVKYRARIQVSKGWYLVGVADEGPAYIAEGCNPDNVLTLKEGEIYACIQLDPNSEPIYLNGNCVISRSPTVHPGDVQRAWAIGEPPENGMICSFRNLKNCVVFPSVGRRSLASCLSGGDLDGDQYNINLDPTLLVTLHTEPAEYPPVPMKEIDITHLADPATKKVDQEKVVPLICDFIVEYINSDVLGLLSDMHMTRADQSSSKGVFDPGCIEIAKLCSQAVDYVKNGVQVDISQVPRRLMAQNPDWKEEQVESPRKFDFYRSERALGYLYREVDLTVNAPETDIAQDKPSLEDHPIYKAFKDEVDSKLLSTLTQSDDNNLEHIRSIFKAYVDELNFICATHTLTDSHDVTLTEEEVVVGTILSTCSQHRWRQERIYRMRLHSGNLVKQVQAEFYPSRRYNPPTSEADTRHALRVAWLAWQFSVKELTQRESGEGFGLNSFGLIALNVVFDCVSVL